MKNKLILRIILGFLNIASGLSYCLLALSLNIFALIAGVLCIILGIAFFEKSSRLKKMFYIGILPLAIICLIIVTNMAITFGSQPPYGIDFIGAIIFIVLPVITCIGNIYYFKKDETI